MAALGWLWFAAVSALIVTVAVHDWRRRLVANGLVVSLSVLAAIFVVVGESESVVVASRWWAAAAAATAFAIGLGVYATGLVAAGDVKLILPVALIMVRLGATSWLLYLGVVIVAAVVVLAVFGPRERSLPLAPVLGLGVVPALLAAPPPWFAV